MNVKWLFMDFRENRWSIENHVRIIDWFIEMICFSMGVKIGPEGLYDADASFCWEFRADNF